MRLGQPCGDPGGRWCLHPRTEASGGAALRHRLWTPPPGLGDGLLVLVRCVHPRLRPWAVAPVTWPGPTKTAINWQVTDAKSQGAWFPRTGRTPGGLPPAPFSRLELGTSWATRVTTSHSVAPVLPRVGASAAENQTAGAAHPPLPPRPPRLACLSPMARSSSSSSRDLSPSGPREGRPCPPRAGFCSLGLCSFPSFWGRASSALSCRLGGRGPVPGRWDEAWQEGGARGQRPADPPQSSLGPQPRTENGGAGRACGGAPADPACS